MPVVQQNPQTCEDAAKMSRLAQKALSMSNPDSVKFLSVIEGQKRTIKELTKAVSELQVQTVTVPDVSVCNIYGQTC